MGKAYTTAPRSLTFTCIGPSARLPCIDGRVVALHIGESEDILGFALRLNKAERDIAKGGMMRWRPYSYTGQVGWGLDRDRRAAMCFVAAALKLLTAYQSVNNAEHAHDWAPKNTVERGAAYSLGMGVPGTAM